MVREASQDQDRIKSAIGVAFLHALLGYALIVGLGVEIRSGADAELKLFDVRLPPPPPRDSSPSAPGQRGAESVG